jgi:hypothetical protein
MKSQSLQIALLVLAIASMSSAQDSHFSPKGQQIPVPECLTMKGLLGRRLEAVRPNGARGVACRYRTLEGGTSHKQAITLIENRRLGR